jgi:hypothetical protein
LNKKQQQDGITPLENNQPSLMTKCKIKPPHSKQYSSVASRIAAVTTEDYERDGISFLKDQPAPKQVKPIIEDVIAPLIITRKNKIGTSYTPLELAIDTNLVKKAKRHSDVSIQESSSNLIEEYEDINSLFGLTDSSVSRVVSLS